ncbi:hypothetical protein B0H13DRAFT_2377038 [Mycena leptocephala]|nr:hypothetical protein B0H13DRAFT_2377038 [Mycena leptocephala]
MARYTHITSRCAPASPRPITLPAFRSASSPTAFFHPRDPPQIARPPRPRSPSVTAASTPCCLVPSARCRSLSLCTNRFARINAVTGPPFFQPFSLPLIAQPARPQSRRPSAANASSLSLHSLSRLHRRAPRCMKRGYLVKLSGYTHASPPTARTDASMDPYVLPHNSSLSCADPRGAPKACISASLPISSPAYRPNPRGYKSFLLPIESLCGPFWILPPRRATPAHIPWSNSARPSSAVFAYICASPALMPAVVARVVSKSSSPLL